MQRCGDFRRYSVFLPTQGWRAPSDIPLARLQPCPQLGGRCPEPHPPWQLACALGRFQRAVTAIRSATEPAFSLATGYGLKPIPA